jgi:hypothetical protein
MTWIKLTENRKRVHEALVGGYVDEVVALRATAFDKLAGAMHEFGYWEQLEAIEIELDKDDDDVPDELLKRELAVMPLLRIPNPHQAPTYLFQDPGVLRFLGFNVAQIRDGFNDKGVRSQNGEPRMRPHHRDTFYTALRAVKEESLDAFRASHLQALAAHELLTGGVFAVDGTGLRNSDRHLVTVQQIGTEVPPFIVNWRVVESVGQEVTVGREMVAELIELVGPQGVDWLLMDGAYVDGAWLADLQAQGIGAIVRVHDEMQIYQDMQGLSRLAGYGYEPHTYVRTIQGHKERHEVELAAVDQLNTWRSYREAWQARGVPEAEWPGLWGLLIREEKTQPDGESKLVEWGLVATQPFAKPEAGFQQWRGRWGIENRGFRELNQGGWLESQTWGRSDPAILTSIALKLGAHNCYCLMQTEMGEEWAVTGLRALQHKLFGSPPQVMVVAGEEYALFSAEELVGLLGVEIAQRLEVAPSDSA